MAHTLPVSFSKRTEKIPVPIFAAEKPIDVETSRRARLSGLGQPQYLRNQNDVQRIQAALRSAERGDTWQLFTLFRDMSASNTHLQAEWAKRKCVITGQPETLIPYSDSEDDKIACEVVRQMIDGCQNWFDALNHLLDATLYPLAAAEKIFEPVGLADAASYKYPLRLKLKEIAPIDPTLLCFKLPYVPNYTSKDNPAGTFNPDEWESWLRFYATNPQGVPVYSMQGIYAPEKDSHIIHRGTLMSPTIPPNFGGYMRMIMFWDLLATQDRDWWALLMNKYGMPIPVAKVNSQQADTVLAMQQALALCTQLGGIVIDSKATIEWAQVAATDSSNAHKIFMQTCNDEISKIVIGQTLSANPKNVGMGSGMAGQAEEVREDIRQFDTMKLSDTLRRQLFKQMLQVNGYSGNAPRIFWGGMREGAASVMSEMLARNASAGLVPTDVGLKTINQKFGIEFKLNEEMAQGSLANAQKGDNPKKAKY